MKNKYKTQLRLNNIKSVNTLLARTINSVIDGTCPEDNARVIGYLCNILLKGLQVGDMELRLEQLEQSLASKGA